MRRWLPRRWSVLHRLLIFERRNSLKWIFHCFFARWCESGKKRRKRISSIISNQESSLLFKQHSTQNKMIFDENLDALCGSISFSLYCWRMPSIHSYDEKGIMFALPYRTKKERRKTVKFSLSWACEKSLKESLKLSTLYTPPPVKLVASLKFWNPSMRERNAEYLRS